MPPSPAPTDGYIRVSVVAGRSGDRFQSPGAQRDAIEGWAKAHGVTIGVIHEDLDRSGGTMDRPGMNAALARIDAGQSSGIIVARLDRFARTVIGGLTTIEALHAKGARVVSVAESIDPATPMGRAMLGLLLIMAQWQRDQANEHLSLSISRAAAAGRYAGKTPFGYVRDPAGQTLVDVEPAAVVRGIYEARAGGAGWRKIADDLARAGVPAPAGGNRWAASTILDLVRSEAYVGVWIGPRDMRIVDAWEPIVDRGLWEQANAIRGHRDSSRRYHDRLYAGLARCAGCRLTLTRKVNPEGYVSYGCSAPGCRQRCSMGAGLLDAHVSGLVDARLARIALEPEALDDDSEVAALVAGRDAAVDELEAWRDDLEIRSALGAEDWREGLLVRARARDAAQAALDRHQGRRVDALGETPNGKELLLEVLPWGRRRQVVEALVHSVWLRRSVHRGPAARRHLAERLLVVFRDDPVLPDLPVRGTDGLGPVAW